MQWPTACCAPNAHRIRLFNPSTRQRRSTPCRCSLGTSMRKAVRTTGRITMLEITRPRRKTIAPCTANMRRNATSAYCEGPSSGLLTGIVSGYRRYKKDKAKAEVRSPVPKTIKVDFFHRCGSRSIDNAEPNKSEKMTTSKI